MARIELAPEIFQDIDRFFDHFAQYEVEEAPSRIAEIFEAIEILANSPLIGRPVREGKPNW